MTLYLCDICKADIAYEAPPHGFEVTIALDTTMFVSGPVVRDESSLAVGAKKYLDWCKQCRLRALKDAIAKLEIA